MTTKKNNTVVYVFLVTILVMLLLFSPGAVAGAKHGAETVLSMLLPSLFPFFVISSLFVRTGFAKALGNKVGGVFCRLFGLPGACVSAVILGLLCGFPVGAKTAGLLYEQGLCSKDQAETVSAFCSNPGMAFVVSFVGSGLYGDIRIGWLLWGVQSLISLITGIVIGRKTEPFVPEATEKPGCGVTSFSALLSASVKDSVRSMVNVGAYVVLFFSVNGMLDSVGFYGVISDVIGLRYADGLLRGLLEMTGGVLSIADRSPASIPYVGLVLGWSGLCVHAQVRSVMEPFGLDGRYLFSVKTTQGVMSFCVLYLVSKMIDTVPVGITAYRQADYHILAVVSVLASFALFLIIFCRKNTNKS